MKRQVIFLGEQGSGKTSIVNKMTNNTPSPNNYQPTIGVDVQFLEHNGHKYRLFDLSGQERFKFMLSHCLVHTDVVVLVGDACNIESIRHLEHWRNLVMAVKRHIPIITVINKCDLVHTNELKKIIDTFSFDMQPLTQVSAQSGDNILSICDLIEVTLHLENKEPSFYGFFSFDSRRYMSMDEESAQSTHNCIVMWHDFYADRTPLYSVPRKNQTAIFNELYEMNKPGELALNLTKARLPRRDRGILTTVIREQW